MLAKRVVIWSFQGTYLVEQTNFKTVRLSSTEFFVLHHPMTVNWCSECLTVSSARKHRFILEGDFLIIF